MHPLRQEPLSDESPQAFHSRKMREREKRRAALQCEADRIASILTAHGFPNATSVAKLLLSWAEELEHIVQILLHHPTVQAQYAYDGRFFTPKGSSEGTTYFKCYDGLHFLQMATEENIRITTRQPATPDGLLEWMRVSVDYAWNRLHNLFADGDIHLVSVGFIQSVITDAQAGHFGAAIQLNIRG